MTALVATHAFAPRSQSPALWSGAALVALALHAALAFAAIWAFQPDDVDDDIGAPAIEIAMDMAAPKSEPTDLPPGPESEASAAAVDSQRENPKVEATEQPKEDPAKTDEADRVVAPEVAPKPQTQKLELDSTASVAAEATAAPTQESSREAPAAVAPSIGPGRNAARERASWQRRLVAHLDRHKLYPAGGARRDVEALVRFTIDRTGRVLLTSIVRSSGAPAFDDAALAMMRRSDPVPAPPAVVADEGLTFTVPVEFRVRGR